MEDAGLVRIKNILKEIPFFEDFNDDELDFFSKEMSLRAIPKDTILFNKGDLSDFFFFIVEGCIEVRLDATRAKNVVATFGYGQSLGEMSLVDEFSRSATVHVTEPSELLILTRSKLDSVVKDNPVIGGKIYKSLAKNLGVRLRNTTGRFSDLI